MKTGTVVVSLTGHDKGTLYVVMKKEGNLIFLCDGKCKKIASPKKKNIRHIKETGNYIELSEYNPLYDAHIRKELKRLKQTMLVI